MFPTALFSRPSIGAGSSGPPPPVAGPEFWVTGATGTDGSLALDISGNGVNATQSNPSDQPPLTANQVNGKPAWVANGSEFLKVADGSLLFTQFTLFVVFKIATPTGVGIPIADMRSPSNSIGCILYASTSGALSVYADPPNTAASDSISTCDGVSHLATLEYDGSNITLYRDGVLVGSISSVSASAGGCLLMFKAFDGAFMTGIISEVLFYGSGLSSSDRKMCQSYEGSKYAIPLGQPQISLVDFNGLLVANFVTNAAGLYFNLFGNTTNSKFYVWFFVANETDPAPVGYNGGIQITLTGLVTAADIAAAVVSSHLVPFEDNWTELQVDGGGTGTAVQISTQPNAGEYYSTSNAADVNTGAAISTLKTGAPNS